jgi:L-ascorbate metabolism protein UlaG (beta-lactamase superfamily)
MKVRFLGHSAFEIRGSKTIYIDPFLTDNPAATTTVDDLGPADLVLVSHDHDDHIADAAALCKRTGAVLVATHEIAVALAESDGIEAEGMNIGGTLDFDGTRVSMVNALHTSPTTDCVGLVVEIDGKVIYHLGDTGLFGDMKLYAEFWSFDLALVPIGDRYTMGPRSAARAVEFLAPRKVVPMHYGTWPIIDQDPVEFAELVGDRAETIILAPGEELEL